jgi:murein DD-endopeptidase MepM/ murein hydrolase activator NlpD
MRSLLFCIAFCMSCNVSLTAQETDLNESISLELPVTPLKSSMNVITVDIPLTLNDSNSRVIYDIKNDYWDTSVFNPYKDSLVQYPLAIHFNDTTIASPVDRPKVITSRYGWRWGRPHQGIDIDLITGDTVRSILSGIVRFAQYDRGLGRTVVVRHFNGLETTYAHLSKISVKVNDTVSKGQFIGKGGNTGKSRGSHLHLVTSYKGQYINPEYLFEFNETNKIRAQELWVTRKWTRAGYHSSRRQSQLDRFTSKEEALANNVPKQKIYIVKRGDTLYGISRRNNVSIRSICQTNSITSGSTLRIGQKLIIEP